VHPDITNFHSRTVHPDITNFHSRTVHPDITNFHSRTVHPDITNFHSRTVHPDITNFIIQLNAQLDHSRLKLTLKIYIKMLLHVSVNKPSSGSLLPCFAKVMIIMQNAPHTAHTPMWTG